MPIVGDINLFYIYLKCLGIQYRSICKCMENLNTQCTTVFNYKVYKTEFGFEKDFYIICILFTNSGVSYGFYMW
jgi:hypothetical protein